MGRTHLTLGIESSCDETAAAVVAEGRTILSNVIATQVDVHKLYGGVVPEIASRMHVEAILPVIDQALNEAGVALSEIEAIAVTYGPGLVGALLVGLSPLQRPGRGQRSAAGRRASSGRPYRRQLPGRPCLGATFPVPDRFRRPQSSGHC
jgi:hypothetical protein